MRISSEFYSIQRADHATAAIQHVGVDHGRFHVGVAEQFCTIR